MGRRQSSVVKEVHFEKQDNSAKQRRKVLTVEDSTRFRRASIYDDAVDTDGRLESTVDGVELPMSFTAKGKRDSFQERRSKCRDSHLEFLQQSRAMTHSAYQNNLSKFNEITNKMITAVDVVKMFTNRKCLLTPQRRSQISLQSDRDVLQTLARIQEAHKKRKANKIKQELQSIQKRVKKTLYVAGMEWEDSDDNDEDEERYGSSPIHFPPVFDTREERERMQERDYIISRMETFEQKSHKRKKLLMELMVWFEENLNMCHDMSTPQQLEMLVAETHDMHKNITIALNALTRTGDKVVITGTALLEETSKIIADRHAQMAKKTRKERMIIYDDKVMLNDPDKMELAVKMVIGVLDDSTKMIKNVMFKNALKLGQKQFEYLMVAADKRNQELDEKKKQCYELNGKVHGAKVANEKLKWEVEEGKKKMAKFSQEIKEQKDALLKLKLRNQELHQQVADLCGKVKYLQEKLNSKPTTPPPPPTPPTPPEPEQIFVNVIDSATELQLHETEGKLQEAQDQITALQKKIAELEGVIVVENGKFTELQERITELEMIPTPEPVVATPVVEVPTEDKDSTYYKTLMSGLKNDFTNEVDKINSYMKREKTRSEATIRKLEMTQKDHLVAIQKDIIRMLRAIMHFRDTMMHVLEKENLHDPVEELQKLGNLVKYKLSQDPREVLALVVGLVVDYLHRMEEIMTNAFLALKVMMKLMLNKQVEQEIALRQARDKADKEAKLVVKVIGERKKVLKGAKNDVKVIAKKLKKAKNKLRKYDNLSELSGDKKFKGLMERYKQVWNLYKTMKAEMESLQSDFNDTMQKKLEEKEAIVITKMNTQIREGRQKKVEQLKMSIKDQRQNLHILVKAYEDNKISKELHLMSTSLIHKTLEIPRRKLRNLFEQYIAFRTTQEAKQRVQEVLEDEDLSENVRMDMQTYISDMDKKINMSLKVRQDEMSVLEDEKRDFHKKINSILNDVLMETGIPLLHPLLKDTNQADMYKQATMTMSRNQMKSILCRRRHGFKGMLAMSDNGLVGSQIPLNNIDDKVWNSKPTPPAEPLSNETSPHMLSYEVNRPKICAIRQLKHMKKEMMVWKTESFNIDKEDSLQFIRDIPIQH